MPRIAYPDTAEAVAEALQDAETVEAFKDQESAAKWIEGVVAARLERDPQIQAQIAEQAQASAVKMARDNGYVSDKPPMGANHDPVAEAEALLKANAAKSSFQRIYNKEALGSELWKDEKIKALTNAEVMQALWYKVANDSRTRHLAELGDTIQRISNDYSSQIGDSGGFLIPEAMRAQLLQHSLEEGVMRGGSMVLPMSTAKMSVPALDDTDRASGLFGAIKTYWTEEAAAMTASEAKFMLISLEPKTLTALATIPDQLIADTAFLGAYFDQTFPPAMAYEEDEAFISGNGVGRPLGWLNAGNNALIEVTRNTASQINYEDVVGMFSRLPASSMGRAIWVADQSTIPQLMNMTFSGIPIMIREGGLPDAPRFSLLGAPVRFTEKVGTIGTRGDLSLVDRSMYMIGDRQTMTAESSNAPGFRVNTTDFRLVERVDGTPALKNAITPRNSGPTLSPYITLAA